MALPSPRVLPTQKSRRERVQATRSVVLRAATDLFLSQGYLATTMGDIAADAGVAVQTLYLRFGGKASLLKACFDVAVSGDDDPVAVADRPWVEQLRDAPDLQKALRLLATSAKVGLERTSPLFSRIEEAAADPEVGELLADLKRQKLEMVGIFATILREKSGFNHELSPEDARDLLYAMGSEELFRLLCLERRWPSERWEDFVFSSLIHRLASPG